jgi:hypothetical protein
MYTHSPSELVVFAILRTRDRLTWLFLLNFSPAACLRLRCCLCRLCVHPSNWLLHSLLPEIFFFLFYLYIYSSPFRLEFCQKKKLNNVIYTVPRLTDGEKPRRVAPARLRDRWARGMELELPAAFAPDARSGAGA